MSYKNPSGNVIIAQSGGPTVVINRTLVALIRELKKHDCFTGIFGVRHSIPGILKEDFIDVRAQSIETLARVAETPASALGSARHKPTPEDAEQIFRVCEKYGVKYLFLIGGNDSAASADIVNRIAQERQFELRIFHIPKTIDNDLLVTDHSPGFGSAARFVALAFAGNNFDNAALPGVKIDVVMGRHAGYLTAASVLAKTDPADGPHLVYVPEIPVSLQAMVADMDAVYKKYGRCMVAVSEGLIDDTGKLMAEHWIQEQDAHGNKQLSGSNDLGDHLARYYKEHTSVTEKLRVRSDTLGTLQRSFPTVESDTDLAEAALVGEAAVKYSLRGDIDGSVVLHRAGEGSQYAVETSLVKLSDVAKGTKSMPREYMNEEGNYPSAQYIEYARPLIGTLPAFAHFKNVPVPKHA